MQKIKLITLDLDGTLLRSDKTLSERNYRALKEAAEAEPMPEGQKGKLNVSKILVNENVLKPAYKDFVRAHADDVFTVEKAAEGYNHIVSLVEDTTEPKWLWKTTDLIAVEE